jgi:tetratricopeptide (TPR) repeat protein
MMKDQFMQGIGFDKVCGDNCFDKAFKRSSWGVDDRAFFDKSTEEIKELQKKEKPWFLTLLTVGTHDPYIVPSDFKSSYKSGTFENAITYLDDSVARFIKELETKNLLNDTLVIITSDESVGLMKSPSDLKRILSQNFGFLTLMLPIKKRMEIDENFQLIDVAASTLDYLGLEDRASLVSGRSFFRSYETPRTIYFGNALKRISGAYVPTPDSTGQLYLCRENIETCKRYATKGDSLFAAEILSVEDIGLGNAVVQEMASISRPLSGSLLKDSIELSAKDSIRLIQGYEQMIMGGQNIPIPEASLIEIELELELTGKTESGSAALTIDAYGDEITKENGAQRGPVRDIMTLPPLSVGDSFTLTNSYSAFREFKKFEFILLTRKLSGKGLDLKVKKAELKITPLTEGAVPGKAFKKKSVVTINKESFDSSALAEERTARFESIVIEEPSNPAALEYLGVSYALSGRTMEAIESFKQALAKSPDRVELHVALRDLYGATNQTELAEFHKKRVEELGEL